MKKIKHIRQLAAEKKRLQKRKEELEKAIRYDWRDLKDSLRPGRQAGSFFRKWADSRQESENGHDFFSDSVSEMAAGLARKLTLEAEEKIRRWFHK